MTRQIFYGWDKDMRIWASVHQHQNGRHCRTLEQAANNHPGQHLAQLMVSGPKVGRWARWDRDGEGRWHEQRAIEHLRDPQSTQYRRCMRRLEARTPIAPFSLWHGMLPRVRPGRVPARKLVTAICTAYLYAAMDGMTTPS